MIDLYLEKKSEKVYAHGHHDKVGKCLRLRAGFQFRACENVKKVFAYYPYIQKLFEKEIIPSAQSMGNNDIFCVTKDVSCYAIDDSPNGNNLDELSIAASIVFGKLMSGASTWKNAEGVTVKKINAVEKPLDVVDELDLNNQRYDEAANVIFKMLHDGKDELIRMLSYGYHLNLALGNQNEDRFTVPRQIDRGGMPKLGFECVETEAYDLIVPGEQQYTASDKIGKEIFHQKVSRKARADTVAGEIAMSNIRSGQSSDNRTRPLFDSLVLMQYNPYLVCGVAPYSKIVKYFRSGDGGSVLKQVPIDACRYIISPTEYFEPVEIPTAQHDAIAEFVEAQRGGVMKKLLDLPLTIVDTSIPETEIW